MFPSTNEVSANILGSRRVENHTEYVVNVFVGGVSHQVFRRYRDFAALYHTMCQVLPLFETSKTPVKVPPLPGKKVFGRMDPQFIASRQAKLEGWLTNVFENKYLLQLKCVFDFLEIPDSLIVGARGSAIETGDSPMCCDDSATLLKLSDFTKEGYEESNASFLIKLLNILFNESWWESSFRVFEFGCGTGLTACTMAVVSTEKFGAASVVGGDAVPEYVIRFRERIVANSVGSSVKALPLASKDGADLDGVYDAIVSSFSLRRVDAHDYETLIRNFIRICRGQGYIVVAEIDVALPPAGNGEDREARKMNACWKDQVLSAFALLGVETLRVHRFFVRRTIGNPLVNRKSMINGKVSGSSTPPNHVMIPSYLLIGRTPAKERRKKKGRE